MAKPAPRKKTAVNQETSWARHFMIGLLVLGLLAIGVVGYYKSDFSEAPTEAYVPVSVTTTAGDGRNVQCQVSLLVDPEKEKALQARMPLLQATMSESLGATYQQGSKRPDVKKIPEQLRQAINEKLPPSLQVREVLIQHLLFGDS